MNNCRNLDPIFSPRSLAVVGASKDMTKSGGMFLMGLNLCEYEGKVFPINPREKEINSLKCYPSVLDLPEPVDLAILTVANRLIPSVLEECATRGIKHAIIHSAGFGEIEDTGKKYEQEIIALAQKHHLSLVGPNCMGVCNPEAGLNTIVATKKLAKEKGIFSFAGQSGWGAENLLLMCNERGVTLRKVASAGNQTNLDIIDYLQYFAQDEGTRIIGAYIEGLKRADQFIRLVKPLAEQKPIIILKGGRSQAGIRAALSHTGSMGGTAAIFEGAARQAGVIRVEYLEEMVDAAVAFSSPIYPKGKRVGLIVEAGGAAVTASDFCEQMGLEVPKLSAEVRSNIEALIKGSLPPSAGLSNPVDLVWPPDNIRLPLVTQTMKLMATEIDSFMFIGYHPFNDPKFTEELNKVRDELQKPIFVIPGHHTENRQYMASVTKAGLPSFFTPYRACQAMATLVRFSTK